MNQTAFPISTPRKLAVEVKKNIAFDALRGINITQTANKHQVSRTTVYVQKEKAQQAIDQVFEEGVRLPSPRK